MGAPMHELAKYAAAMARPEMERRSVWHLLAGGDHWAVILIRHTRKGSPPEKPARRAPRLSPEWLRRTGAALTAEQLLHERIGQHLKAHVQNDTEVDVARAASIATDAALSALAELGITLPTSKEPTTDGS